MATMKTLNIGGRSYEVMDDAARIQIGRKMDLTGWTANKFIGTDSLGNIVTKDMSEVHTPVRGEDYWTDEDIAEIKGYVDSAILNGVW